MRYLKVAAWDDIQYDASKDLPWVKLHTDLLSPVRAPWYADLTDGAKALLLHLWLLARVFQNRIPETWLTKERLNLRSRLNFESLFESNSIWFEDEDGTRDESRFVLGIDSSRGRGGGVGTGKNNTSPPATGEGEREREGRELVAELVSRGLRVPPSKRRSVAAWVERHGAVAVLEAFEANSEQVLLADHPLQYLAAILRNRVPTSAAPDDGMAALDALREWARARKSALGDASWPFDDISRDDFAAWLNATGGTLTDAGGLKTVERWRSER